MEREFTDLPGGITIDHQCQLQDFIRRLYGGWRRRLVRIGTLGGQGKKKAADILVQKAAAICRLRRGIHGHVFVDGIGATELGNQMQA